MEAKAKIKYLRIGPRKVRHILNLLRHKYVGEAFDILANMNKKGARLTEQLLKSAVAGAKGKKMDENTLFISDIRADGGPTLKRFMARAMGRADRILKRTTHLSVVLIEKGTKKVEEKRAEAKAVTGAKKVSKKKPEKEKKVKKAKAGK